MRVGLDTRDRRALIFGSVLVGGLLGVRYAVVPSIQSFGELRQRVALEREALWRERSLVRDARTLRREFEVLSEWLIGTAPGLYGASDSETAHPSFLRYLEGAVMTTGVAPGSIRERSRDSQSRLDASPEAVGVSGGGGEIIVQMPKSAAAQLLLPIRATLSGEGGFEDVLTLIVALETGPKIVVIEGLELEATPAPPDLMERILFSIDVIGISLDTGTEGRGHGEPGDTRVERRAGGSP